MVVLVQRTIVSARKVTQELTADSLCARMAARMEGVALDQTGVLVCMDLQDHSAKETTELDHVSPR